MKITFAEETDYITRFLNSVCLATPRSILEGSVIAILPKEERMLLIKKQEATQYFIKKHDAIIVDIPKLPKDKGYQTVQIALAVGRRLERFERGQKANAGRDANSRREIAQNAIQARWSAK